MQSTKAIGVILLAGVVTACGGGGGSASYAGKWRISLTPETNESSAHCVRNPQPIEEVVTINQDGKGVSVYFDTGDVLANAGETFPGRLDPDSMIAGKVSPEIRCPRGYIGRITQTIVFNCPPGNTCDQVARVVTNSCPNRDYLRDDSIIRDSPSCVTTWRGTGEKLLDEGL